MQLAPMTGAQAVASAPNANAPTSSQAPSTEAEGTRDAFADLLQRARHQGGRSQPGVADRSADRSRAEPRQQAETPRGPHTGAGDADEATKVAAQDESARASDDTGVTPDAATSTPDMLAPPTDAPWLPTDLAAARSCPVEQWRLSTVDGAADVPAEASNIPGAAVGEVRAGRTEPRGLTFDPKPAEDAAAAGLGADDPSPTRVLGARDATVDGKENDRSLAWVPGAHDVTVDGEEGGALNSALSWTDPPAPAPQNTGLEGPVPGQTPVTALTALASSWSTAAMPDNGTGSTTVAEHEVRAPVHSPEFAPALGAQLTLLVKDGVTEARLHLNPAEMGPIAVQIQLDGTQARVEMVAEQAATRQVLEQSMPSLAGALRESGLTLAGGGVFEQSARREPADRPGTGDGRRSGTGQAAGDGGVAGAPAAPRTVAVRGLVDLFA